MTGRETACGYPFAVAADGESANLVEGPDSEGTTRCHDLGVSVVCLGDDSA